MGRASYLTVPQMFDLQHVCRSLRDAFGHIYLVGSSITRADYRDVDVRCILPDEDYDRMFPLMAPGVLLHLMNRAVTEWLAARTGLPIDFQFQRRTEANAEFSGQRHALGVALGVGFNPPAASVPTREGAE